MVGRDEAAGSAEEDEDDDEDEDEEVRDEGVLAAAAGT